MSFPLLRYAVIARADEWRVLSGRAQIGHFQTRAEAWAVAIGLAKQAAAAGCGVELLAQAEASDCRLDCLYRYDPAPTDDVHAGVARPCYDGLGGAA